MADAKIKGHVALRGNPLAEDEEGLETVDLDSLRSNTRHLPPADLKPRNFFTSFMSGELLSVFTLNMNYFVYLGCSCREAWGESDLAV